MVVGVLVAVALLSSTPLYSNALNDLGLAHALREKPIELLDVHIYARSYHIDLEDYSRGRELVDRRASQNIGALVRQEERYIKSQTFSVVWADHPTPDGPDRSKGYFQVFTNLEKHVALLEGRYPDLLPSGLSQEESAQIDDQSVLEQLAHRFVLPKEDVPGAAGKEVWTFKALKEGSTEASMEYSRPWEGEKKAEWTFGLIVVVK